MREGKYYYSRVGMDSPLGQALKRELEQRQEDFRGAHRYNGAVAMGRLVHDLLAERLSDLLDQRDPDRDFE
jgi:hypothetical protein